MIDDLLAEIAEAGWLLNNCYQIDAYLWRVNLRREVEDGAYFSDWAEGPSLEIALGECMDKLSQAEFVETTEQTYLQAKPKARINLLTLGLVKPIERRI